MMFADKMVEIDDNDDVRSGIVRASADQPCGDLS